MPDKKNGIATRKQAAEVEGGGVEQFMQLPPWLVAIRDAMAESLKPDDLQAVMAAQVVKAKAGDATAAAFIMNQAHRLLNAEQRRPVTITQTNNYYEGDARPDTPAAAEPGTAAAERKMQARVAAGMPVRSGADRPIHAALRADSDEDEKELRRRMDEEREEAA